MYDGIEYPPAYGPNWRSDKRHYYGNFRHYAPILGGATGHESFVWEGMARDRNQDLLRATQMFAERLAELQAEWRAYLRDPDRSANPTDPTKLRAVDPVWELIDHHVEQLAMSATEDHAFKFKRQLRGFVFGLDGGPYNKRTTFEEITYATLWRWIKARRRVTGASNATIWKDLSALKGLLEEARLLGIIETNPVSLISTRRFPNPAPAKRDWPDTDQVRDILDACLHADQTSRFHLRSQLLPFIAGLAYLGARAYSELAHVRVADVGVPPSGVRGHTPVAEHFVRIHMAKGRASQANRARFRLVPYWPELQAIWKHWVDRRILEGAGPQDLLLPSPKSREPLKDIRNVYHTALVDAGVTAWADPITGGGTSLSMTPSFTPHSLRHTYTAMRLQTIELGHPVTLERVQQELGHSGPTMIARHYSGIPRGASRSEFVEYDWHPPGDYRAQVMAGANIRREVVERLLQSDDAGTRQLALEGSRYL